MNDSDVAIKGGIAPHSTKRMTDSDKGAVKFRRLYDLIKQNYSYQVFEAIRSFKAQLSVDLSRPPCALSLRHEDELTHVWWATDQQSAALNSEIDAAVKAGTASAAAALRH